MLISSSSITGHLSLAGCLATIYIISLLINTAQVEGRKCICTSKGCKEAGLDTCKTKFSCYTELILTAEQSVNESTATRGCIEDTASLLCSTKSRIPKFQSVNTMEPSLTTSPWARVHWPKLRCCNSHDYCNADQHVNTSTWIHKEKTWDPTLSTADREIPNNTMANHNTMIITQSDYKYQDERSTNQLYQHHVKSLYIAALVLIIAAFISVLAACYVVTRLAYFSHKDHKDINSLPIL